MVSVDTVTRVPDTFFSAMFSGGHSLQPDIHGCHFIDRDGTYFQHILNYFRDGDSAYLPSDKVTLESLLREANFYNIPSLLNTIERKLMPYLSEREVFMELGLKRCVKNIVFNGTVISLLKSTTRNSSFDNSVISDVTFRQIYFEGPVSFRRSTLKNVVFDECYFKGVLDFSGSDLTDISFKNCPNLVKKVPVMIGATQHGVSFDAQELYDIVMF